MRPEPIKDLVENATAVIDNYNLDPEAEIAVAGMAASCTMMKSDLLWAYGLIDAIRDGMDIPRDLRPQVDGWLDHYRMSYEDE